MRVKTEARDGEKKRMKKTKPRQGGSTNERKARKDHKRAAQLKKRYIEGVREEISKILGNNSACRNSRINQVCATEPVLSVVGLRGKSPPTKKIGGKGSWNVRIC